MADENVPGMDDYVRRLFRIESGGDPNAVTGSNRGLGQFGPEEERRYGITPQNRTDSAVQAAAVAKEFEEHRAGLARVLGRDPTFGEAYVGHQQGIAGGPALLDPKNASLPAWQAIRPYYKSDAMAQKAITGNIPRNSPLHSLGVDDISASGFASYWKDKFERGMMAGGGALPSVPSSTALHPAAAAFNRPSAGDPYTAGPAGSSTPSVPQAGDWIKRLFGLGQSQQAPGQAMSVAAGMPDMTPAGSASPAAPQVGQGGAGGAGGSNNLAQIQQIMGILNKQRNTFPFPDFKLDPVQTGPMHPLPLRMAQLNQALPQNLPFAGNSGTGTGG